MNKKGNSKWIVVVVVLLFLGLFSIIVSGILGLALASTSSGIMTGNVAVIPITGLITSFQDSSVYGSSGMTSAEIINMINEATLDPEIKAIILEINSGGGYPVASDEITTAIEKSNKTTIAWIREVGASGAYMIASGTDKIYASRMSIVGSIGVRGSYLEFAGFLNDNNVTYRRLVAGDFKDMGSPYKELTAEEEFKLQNTLNEMHDIFIDIVATNRNMTKEQVEPLATGEVFTGYSALNKGLVDEIGGLPQIVHYLEQSHNLTVELREYESEKSLLEILGGVSVAHGKSIGQGIRGETLNQPKAMLS